MSFDPLDRDRKTAMNKAVRFLESLLPNANFTLLVFDKQPQPGHEERRVNYIGNTNRLNMLASVREFLYKHEGKSGKQQLLDTLPLAIPEGTAPGTTLAVVFTVTENGVEGGDLWRWNEGEVDPQGSRVG